MELSSKFLPQFRVSQQQQFNCIFRNDRTKRDSVIILSMFSREPPAQYYRWKNLGLHNIDPSVRQLALSDNESSKVPELSFTRLQLPEEECTGVHKRNFGCFVVREAVLNEEYWTAAWLRAEAHFEAISYMRNVQSHKIKYAEQEFNALKRRCSGQGGNSLNCFCFVAERKRSSMVLASKESSDAHRYAYIANVVVAKFARRRGIASNMLYLATDVAKLSGVKQLFVHVNADNQPALDLYLKTGFKVFDTIVTPLSKDEKILMFMEL